LWLHSLKVAQLLRSAACLHTNQSRSYLNHLVDADEYGALVEWYWQGKPVLLGEKLDRAWSIFNDQFAPRSKLCV